MSNLIQILENCFKVPNAEYEGLGKVSRFSHVYDILLKWMAGIHVARRHPAMNSPVNLIWKLTDAWHFRDP